MAAPAGAGWAFGLTVMGGFWLLLWRSRWRWIGVAPLLLGTAIMATRPMPDILVTGDGRHVAVRSGQGMALLRDGAGDYVRDMLAESAGHDGPLDALRSLPQARCSVDLCAVYVTEAGGGSGDRPPRRWLVLLTRSRDFVERPLLQRDCARADIVISDRGLPHWCRPRWLKIDRRLLARSGGLALYLRSGTIATVNRPGDAHPWILRRGERKAGDGAREGRRRRWRRNGLDRRWSPG